MHITKKYKHSKLVIKFTLQEVDILKGIVLVSQPEKYNRCTSMYDMAGTQIRQAKCGAGAVN